MRLRALSLVVCFAMPCAGQTPAPLVPGMVLGSHAQRPGEGMIQGNPGSQFALWVSNRKNVALGAIRSVSFFIDEQGAPQQPFRVHVCQANGPTAAPGADLLPQPLLVAAPVGGKWFSVDLSAYHIPAPATGFFVVMEWVNSPDKPGADEAVGEAHMLRPTFEFKESLTWSYTVGKGWSLLTLSNGQGRAYNAMMKAEVDIIK
jgi:hypothetical protein